jgi:SAM-dependent methyltransferase
MSFGSIAEDYDGLRPQAPHQAVDWLVPPGCGVAVDVGAGTGLFPDASADAVFVSSAWHWMEEERAVPEIGRVLRDGGRFGLIWTSRDREVDWVRNLDRLPGQDASEAEAADRMRRRLDVVLPEPRIFDNIAREKFRFVRTMTVADVVAMVGTYSRVIVASPDDRSRRLAQARAAVEARFPGADTIEVPMRAWCWRADRIARGALQ